MGRGERAARRAVRAVGRRPTLKKTHARTYGRFSSPPLPSTLFCYGSFAPLSPSFPLFPSSFPHSLFPAPLLARCFFASQKTKTLPIDDVLLPRRSKATGGGGRGKAQGPKSTAPAHTFLTRLCVCVCVCTHTHPHNSSCVLRSLAHAHSLAAFLAYMQTHASSLPHLLSWHQWQTNPTNKTVAVWRPHFVRAHVCVWAEAAHTAPSGFGTHGGLRRDRRLFVLPPLVCVARLPPLLPCFP